MKEYKNNLVSIIVITYNSSKYVLETLESAKNQTYNNIELIVSDDASKDDTVQVCREWIERNKERFVKTQLIVADKNTGIPGNCNRGVKAASGEWIKLIAGDDALMEGCIQSYVDFHKTEPNALIMFSNVDRYFSSFEPENKLALYPTRNLKISQSNVTSQEQFQILLRANKVWTNSLFISKSVFDKYGLYDESLRYWEDRPFLLKVTKQGVKLHYVDIISCKYRKHKGSIQMSKKEELLFSPFLIEKEAYYLQHYVKYLPLVERVCKRILISRVLIIDRLNINKNNLFSHFILKLTAFPWKFIIKKFSRKYI